MNKTEKWAEKWNSCVRKPVITQVTVTPKEAIELAKEQGVGMTMPTLLSWVEKYHLGYKVGGRWRIQTQKFIDYLNGEARNATTATRHPTRRSK